MCHHIFIWQWGAWFRHILTIFVHIYNVVNLFIWVMIENTSSYVSRQKLQIAWQWLLNHWFHLFNCLVLFTSTKKIITSLIIYHKNHQNRIMNNEIKTFQDWEITHAFKLENETINGYIDQTLYGYITGWK